MRFYLEHSVLNIFREVVILSGDLIVSYGGIVTNVH